MDDRTVYDLAIEYAGGWVPTAELALKIAKTLVCGLYDEIEWDLVQPLRITLDGEVWHLSTAPELNKETRLEMAIAKRECAIHRFEMKSTINALEAMHLRMRNS